MIGRYAAPLGLPAYHLLPFLHVFYAQRSQRTGARPSRNEQYTFQLHTGRKSDVEFLKCCSFWQFPGLHRMGLKVH